MHESVVRCWNLRQAAYLKLENWKGDALEEIFDGAELVFGFRLCGVSLCPNVDGNLIFHVVADTTTCSDIPDGKFVEFLEWIVKLLENHWNLGWNCHCETIISPSLRLIEGVLCFDGERRDAWKYDGRRIFHRKVDFDNLVQKL